MDPRIDAHAEVLVDYATDVQQGDLVHVSAPPSAGDLKRAIYGKLGERGATPAGTGGGSRAFRNYLVNLADPEAVEPAEHTLAMLEAADVSIHVMGGTNVAEMSDVPPEKMQAYSRINEPLLEYIEGGDLRRVLTQYPTTGTAQKAEMSTDAYEDFVYDAVNRDWAAQKAFQEPMVDILEEGDEVRVVAGEETDISMSIAGNPGGNDHGERNIPAGEAFTAPIPDSVEGTVRFDLPVVRQGREVEGARLTFEDGEVVDHAAESNEAVLTSIIETDEGSRRVGELGIGMNRDIDRFTKNMLFDEKMGDTVHLALGRSLSEVVGEDNEYNESAVHVDMLVDVSEDARIEVDGEVVQREGVFAFESDFPG